MPRKAENSTWLFRLTNPPHRKYRQCDKYGLSIHQCPFRSAHRIKSFIYPWLAAYQRNWGTIFFLDNAYFIWFIFLRCFMFKNHLTIVQFHIKNSDFCLLIWNIFFSVENSRMPLNQNGRCLNLLKFYSSRETWKQGKCSGIQFFILAKNFVRKCCWP